MISLDPVTIGITAGFFAVGLALILLISRIGLGSSSRGIRTWLVGDVALIAARYPTIADSIHLSFPLPISPAILASGLIAAGVAFHWLAVRRHVNARMKARTGLYGGALVGLGVTLGCTLLDEPSSRTMFFHAALIVIFCFSVADIARRARRFWGARLLALAFIWGFVANVGMFVFTIKGATSINPSTANLLMSAAMTMLTVSALLLWLQQELREHLVEVAVTDALTGALNRRGLLPQLERELALAKRSGRPVSVVVCDLDHFKRINDEHGHSAGDEVLKRFVLSARSLLRSHDLIGRWGGEEFLFVLPDTTCAEAVEVVDRVRIAQIPAADSLPRVTVSAGVATATNRSTSYRIDELLACADARLYLAKETRNRVVGTDVHDECVAVGREPAGREANARTTVRAEYGPSDGLTVVHRPSIAARA